MPAIFDTAKPEDVKTILNIQSETHVSNTSAISQGEGFITIEFEGATFLSLIEANSSWVFVARINSVVAGYAIATDWESQYQSEMQKKVWKLISGKLWNEEKITDKNSCFGGPVCFTSAFRRSGFGGEFTNHCYSLLNSNYRFVISFVDFRNEASMKLHTNALAAEPLLDMFHNGNSFRVFICDISKKKGSPLVEN